MYVPRTFEETDIQALHAFIVGNPLATLVTHDDADLCADHIPLLLATAGDSGCLLQGHVARANPLWRNIGKRRDALAVFQDTGGYITPSWYATKAETHKVVPTWNYIAVHAYGTARAVEDRAWLSDFLERLTRANEAGRATPWQISDAPEDYIAGQLQGIVGIEITVSRLIGKWKMSQNRLPRDVEGVIAGLRATGEPAAGRMADEVEARRRAD